MWYVHALAYLLIFLMKQGGHELKYIKTNFKNRAFSEKEQGEGDGAVDIEFTRV